MLLEYNAPFYFERDKCELRYDVVVASSRPPKHALSLQVHSLLMPLMHDPAQILCAQLERVGLSIMWQNPLFGKIN